MCFYTKKYLFVMWRVEMANKGYYIVLQYV